MYQILDGNSNPISGCLNTNWQTNSNAAATVCTASKAAVALKQYVVTGFTGYSDAAGATLSIKQDTTVKFQTTMPVGFIEHTFGSPIIMTANKTANLIVSGATAACDANLEGWIKDDNS
jgi:hypothetical protein